MISKTLPGSMDATPIPDSTRVVLCEDLVIADSAALQGELAHAASLGKPIVLDGSRVQQVHTAAIQLLVALARDAEEWGIPVQWDGVSAPLEEAVGLLGAARALSIPHIDNKED